MPLGPSGAPGMRVRDGESRDVQLATMNMWHCGICLWKGLNGMMYYEVSLVKVSEPVIYSQASYTDIMTVQSEGNGEQKHKLNWVDEGWAWETLWGISCWAELSYVCYCGLWMWAQVMSTHTFRHTCALNVFILPFPFSFKQTCTYYYLAQILYVNMHSLFM